MDDSDENMGPSEKDFQCSCCYELMVDPTTLNCGHSFCRICLAQWWCSSKKTTCPECRQSWQGFPKINIIIRKTIKKMFPEIILNRKEVVENQPNYQRVINMFEAFGVRRTTQRQSGNQGQLPNRWKVVLKSLCLVTAIIGISMFLYDLFGVMFSWDQPLVHKPIEVWSPADVSNWVSSLGPWSREIQAEKFLELGINGKILKSLTDSGLEDLLEIKKSYLRESLLSEIEHVKILGFKAPTELWEYKALFPTRCMFLLWGFREYPRATIIYTFIFLRKEVFLPLLFSTSELQHQANFSLDPWDDEWHPPPVEILRFSVRAMLTPYYLLGKFAFQWIHVNWWSVGIVVVFCVLRTATELLQLRWLLVGGWKNLPNIILETTKSVLVNGAFYMVLWHILPSFICDVIFYWLMFTAPLYAWNSLTESFSTTRLAVGPVENTPLELTKSLLGWVWINITRRFEN